jgi:hypothetical protein
MENLTPLSVDSETQSQSFRRKQEQPQQAYLIPAALISHFIAGSNALTRGFVNLVRWLTVTGAAVWMLSRSQNGGTKTFDIVAVVILLTLNLRRTP